MNTDEHRFPMILSEPALCRLNAAVGKWMGESVFGLILEQTSSRAALGGSLFVIRLAAPDDFSRIIAELGIDAADADELIAQVAGDIDTLFPSETDTHTETIPTTSIDL